MSLSLCPSLLSSQSEREEFETEYKEKYERDRVLLTDENKKLSSELDKVKHLFPRTHSRRKALTASNPASLMICLSLTHTQKGPRLPNPR